MTAIERAKVLLRGGRSWPVREVLELMDGAITACPSVPRYYFLRGSVYRAIGEHSKAFLDYAEAVRLRPDPAFLAARAAVLLSLGSVNESLADCSAALDMEPAFPPALYHRGCAHYAAGNCAQAEADFAGVLNELAKNPASMYEDLRYYALYNRAACRRALGNLPGAAADLRAAASCPGSTPAANNALGLVAAESGQWEAALEAFNSAVGAAPASPAYLVNRAIALWHCGRASDAASDCDAAIALEKRDAARAGEAGNSKGGGSSSPTMAMPDPTPLFYRGIVKLSTATNVQSTDAGASRKHACSALEDLGQALARVRQAWRPVIAEWSRGAHATLGSVPVANSTDSPRQSGSQRKPKITSAPAPGMSAPAVDALHPLQYDPPLDEVVVPDRLRTGIQSVMPANITTGCGLSTFAAPAVARSIARQRAAAVMGAASATTPATPAVAASPRTPGRAAASATAAAELDEVEPQELRFATSHLDTGLPTVPKPSKSLNAAQGRSEVPASGSASAQFSANLPGLAHSSSMQQLHGSASEEALQTLQAHLHRGQPQSEQGDLQLAPMLPTLLPPVLPARMASPSGAYAPWDHIFTAAEDMAGEGMAGSLAVDAPARALQRVWQPHEVAWLRALASAHGADDDAVGAAPEQHCLLAARIQHAIGLVHQFLGQYRTALLHFACALAVLPVHAPSVYHAGVMHFAVGQHAVAVALLSWVVERTRGHDARAFEARGLAQQALGQHDAAAHDFSAALRLDSRGELYYHRAISQLAGDEPQVRAAVADLVSAVRAGWAKAEVYDKLATAYLFADNIAGAVSAYTSALQAHPGHVVYLCRRAQCYNELQDFESAVHDLSEACEYTSAGEQRAAVLYLRGLSQYAAGSFEDALADLGEALEHGPPADALADVWYRRGLAFANLDEYAQADTCFTHAIQALQEHAELQYAMLRGGDPRLFEELAHSHDLLFVRFVHERAKARQMIGEHELAVADFSAVLDACPQAVPACFRRAFSYKALGEYARAAKDFEAACRLAPHDSRLKMSYEALHSVDVVILAAAGDEPDWPVVQRMAVPT